MKPSKTTDEIEAGIRRLKPLVADRFVESFSSLPPEASEQQREQWQNICWHLADAGWHGWETANDFIELTAKVSDFSELLDIGRYCLQFVENSFEPGRSYLRGVALLGDKVSRAKLEATGAKLRERYQQASNLHNHYFKSAVQVAEQNNLEDLDAWYELTRVSGDVDRASLMKFLQLSEQAPVQSWQNLLPIADGHFENLLTLLAFSQELKKSFAPVEVELLEIVAGLADESADGFLKALENVLPLIGESRSRTLMALLGELDNVDQCAALVEVAERLPLDQEWLVNEWLARRPESENQKAIIAYLQIASGQSEAQLQGLLGKVRLSEELRSLQLFSEGLCGTRLRIEAGESLPASDSLVIYLPGEISIYETRADNYRWLKIALMHQLGCYEFGTFELRAPGGESYTVFAREFNQFDQPMLAELIFSVCEAARIDWRVAAEYPGCGSNLSLEKSAELARRETSNLSPRRRLIESLIQCSLDGQVIESDADCLELSTQLQKLKNRSATVHDSLTVLAHCYDVISKTPIDLVPIAPVGYRGHVAFDDANINLQLTALEDLQAELAEEYGEDEESVEMHGTTDPKDIDVDELEAGDVDNPSAILPADDELSGDDFDQVDDPAGLKRVQQLMQQRQAVETTYRYDEWDYGIQDYRRRWCTLFEFRQLEQDFDFVPNTLAEHRALANRVRRQLNMLRPELLRKVKGVSDGEELDLERAIEAMVDKKSGVSPSEHIYVQRQRKERDVAALFLLDMSASTDDLIEPEPTVYTEQEDDFLHGFSFDTDEPPKERGKTILDLEKESVVLMAEALEGLGDSYAVCGFSGYGRDRIEYCVCKDFDEPYNYQAKANIGGIKPCRSTRMGPAIRHATKMLAETESRIKALIIISDGYPQDFDYGQDRNSKDYGIKDTTKALSEASQKGVQSFCLTVDPSGHDYLREMCPDQSYMVMQDITQLPDELSKVYRGLTS